MMKRVYRIISFILNFGLAYIIAFFIKLVNKNMRNIWIISERGDDARDNGFFFYKYMRENHPEQKIYYVIKKSSVDYNKVSELGKTIEFCSFKHFLVFALSKIHISSSVWGGDIPMVDYYKKMKLYDYENKFAVFLQHGIIKDFQPGLMYPKIKPDIFICGAAPEFNYINREFNHPTGVVQYTGLARFDNLHAHKEKKQILIMPTFRKWIQGMSKEEFLHTEFFSVWNSLLNNEKIIEKLDETGINLIFYPHYEIQDYVNCFNSNSPRVIIADFNNYDVQQLLMESKLLITDFSSVFFDFAYMKKPVIFYQFDRAKYIKKHYDFTKGYFDYDSMGFGEVVTSESKLVKALIDELDNDFLVLDKYINRTNEFFSLYDMNNCKRIYDAIKKLK